MVGAVGDILAEVLFGTSVDAEYAAGHVTFHVRLAERVGALVRSEGSTLAELVDALPLAGGRVVFDSNVANHHHFIEVDTGKIHDVPWDSLRVENVERLSEFEIAEYQVVLRGRKKKKGRQSARASL